jgi:signal transduction histidine kinase
MDVAAKVCIEGSVVPVSEIAVANPRFSHYHLIRFEDNGIGFPQEYAHKAFDIFTRLHNDPQRTGTGVGLTICKKIVENHEGFIQVKSLTGTGTTFFVYLPKRED